MVRTRAWSLDGGDDAQGRGRHGRPDASASDAFATRFARAQMSWSVEEILDFLVHLERLDLALTEEQAQAAADYARNHARRFALILDAFAPLIPRGARIFSVGSMPNHLELLFARYLDATVIGSTYSPRDHRDKVTAVYRSPDGARFAIDVYLRDFTHEPFPVEAESCDAVLCFEVIEHLLESPLPIFREVKRVLRADGHLLLSTPNVQHWHRIFCSREFSFCPVKPLLCRCNIPGYHQRPHFRVAASRCTSVVLFCDARHEPEQSISSARSVTLIPDNFDSPCGCSVWPGDIDRFLSRDVVVWMVVPPRNGDHQQSSARQ